MKLTPLDKQIIKQALIDRSRTLKVRTRSLAQESVNQDSVIDILIEWQVTDMLLAKFDKVVTL